MKKIMGLGAITLIFDQIIKIVVSQNMLLNSSIKIINNFFSITYVRNYGAAFSILNGNRFFLIGITILAILLIYFTLIKDKKIKTTDIIIYGILLGGILGNLVDRVIYGSVIDYLDFNLFGYDFPIFNLADICIVISIILILVTSLWRDNNGKNNC